MNTEVEVYDVDSGTYTFQHEIIRFYPTELYEMMFTEDSVKKIEEHIRKAYKIDSDDVLDGIFFVPSLTTLYVVFYIQGEILPGSYTQSSTINLFISDDIVIHGCQLFADTKQGKRIYEISQNEFYLEYELFCNLSDTDLREIFTLDGMTRIEEAIKCFYPDKINSYIVSDGFYLVPSENKLYVIFYENGAPIFEKTQMCVIIPFLSNNLSLSGKTIEY